VAFTIIHHYNSYSMKKTILLSALFILSITLKAQHTVSGYVTDTRDTLLPGVSVYIPEFQKFCISEEGGTYILRNVGTGTVNIQFTRVGYKTVVKTINTRDSATVLNIKMEPTSMELEEVVVTSNSTKLPDNLPYSVSTHTISEFKKNGDLSIMQSLSRQPGVDKISMGNGISKPIIRGLSFSRILLYQNGTRMETQPWDDRHDLGISDNGLDKVEIVRGPAGLIYGADALGGALIFIDEKPAPVGTTKGDVNLGFYTNTLGYSADAGLKETFAKGVFYQVRLGRQMHTSYLMGVEDKSTITKDTEYKPFAPNSKWGNANAKATAGLSRKWGVSKITYSYFSQKTGMIEDEGDNIQSPDVFNHEQRAREFEAPLQNVTSQVVSNENTIVAKHSKININLSYQDNDRREFEPNGLQKKGELAFGLKLNTITYDAKWNSDAEKKFGVTIGSQGMFQKNENFGLESLVPDANVNDMAGYALLRYDVSKWNFLAGLRYDMRHIEIESYEGGEEHDSLDNRPELNMEKDYTPINGSIGVAFHPEKDITLKVNAASGFTAPNYAELGTWGRHEGTFRFEKGNSSLDIEQNGEVDAGVLWETKLLDVNLAGFYNHINGYIYIRNTGMDTTLNVNGVDTILPIYLYSQDNAVLSGMEASLDIHPEQVKWIDLMLTYAMTKGTLDRGGNLPYIPANKMTAELKIHAKDFSWMQQPYFSIIASNYSAQKNVDTFEEPTDGYTLLDLNLGFNVKWDKQVSEIRLGVTNLLNTQYDNHLSLVKTIFVHEMGRNIFINLRFPFGIKGK
jgi:iron complex outermembrane receptor protein